LTLPWQRQVCDVRSGKELGKVGKLNVTVQPYEPLIFAVGMEKLAELEVSAPERAARGGWMEVGVRFAHPSTAAVHVFHVDVVDPAGKVAQAYSGNWIGKGGEAWRRIPLAMNDATGRWEIRVRDVISGQRRQAAVDVY
jgi:hypothetical protein